MTGKVRKATAVLLTGMMVFSLVGCGKKKQPQFTVPREKLPSGVFERKIPAPNKEKQLVRFLTYETMRQYAAAEKYTRALIHYDIAKGNAQEHKKLALKAKEAWKNVRDFGSIATYLATQLHERSRRKDYNPYLAAAPGEKGFSLMATASAAKKIEPPKNIKTKEEIYAKDSPADIRKMLDNYKEEKQLLGLTRVLHADGKTACDIMREVYPEKVQSGRSWEDIGWDTAYRSANVAKTAGKVAGTGLACVAVMASGGGALTVVAGGAASVKIVDTSIDGLQTAHVLFTGEESKQLNEALKYTGTADTALSVVTFVGGVAGGGVKGAKDTINSMNKIMGQPELKGKELFYLAKDSTLNDGVGVLNGLKDAQDNFCSTSVIKNADNSTSVRSTSLNTKNLSTQAAKDKLAAVGLDTQEVRNSIAEKKEKAVADAVASTKDFVQEAEKIENAGNAGKYTVDLKQFVGKARDKLMQELCPGGDTSRLDKILSEMAGTEITETRVSLKTDGQGNITEFNVTGNVKNPKTPKEQGNTSSSGYYDSAAEFYAAANVERTYTVTKGVDEPTEVKVTNRGGRLYIEAYAKRNSLDGKPAFTTEGFVSSYNAKTGIGTYESKLFGKYGFRFTGKQKPFDLEVVDLNKTDKLLQKEKGK